MSDRLPVAVAVLRPDGTIDHHDELRAHLGLASGQPAYVAVLQPCCYARLAVAATESVPMSKLGPGRN